MKIKIIRSKFLEGLKKVQNIVVGNSSMQIIQNVLIETGDNEISMTTTDLDVSIRSKVTCEVVEEGGTTLPVKLLFETISKVAEGPVEIEVSDNNLATISAGSAVFKMAGMDRADFPALPSGSGTYSHSLPQAVLREMFRKTAYSASQDDSRRALKGVLMAFKENKLTMVATDGRRLSLVEHEMEFPEEAQLEIVLPIKVVSELQRVLASDGDVKITIEKTQAVFDLGSTQIYSKLLSDPYPNYRQVIPDDYTERISVDRKLLLVALDRASVMMTGEANSTRLTFDSNELVVSSAAHDVGEARDIVPIKYSGERLEIIFNPGYVMDCLKAIDDDEVFIELKSATMPAVIKCEAPFLYVIMPLRTN